jgi:hypothetical protein
MNTEQIEHALTTNHRTKGLFQAVLPCDRLPPPTRQQGAYVVNTDPAHLPGEHWTVLHYQPTTVTYFDSYGQPPPKRLRDHLKNSGALRGKTLHYNSVRVQGFRATCGYYCIYYVLTLTTKDYTMDIFKDNLDFNDRYVRAIVRSLFPCNKKT